jgi:ribosomal-protein-alanine N-acetyltransferase
MHIETALENDDLLLRSLSPEDATPAYFNWLWDPEINAFLEVRFNLPRDLGDLRSFVREISESPHSLLFGIFKRDTLKHIGNIKLGPINQHHQVADLGFLVGDRSEWGKGYASSAIMLVTEYAFMHLGLAKVTASCYAQNEGSRRSLLKAGFREDGRQPLQWNVNGTRQDGLLFSKIHPNIR